MAWTRVFDPRNFVVARVSASVPRDSAGAPRPYCSNPPAQIAVVALPVVTHSGGRRNAGNLPGCVQVEAVIHNSHILSYKPLVSVSVSRNAVPLPAL